MWWRDRTIDNIGQLKYNVNMVKDDLTKAQQDLVDHIEAGKKPGVGHNHPPDEGEEQDNPELFDWKEKYENEHKLRQEAETETILIKGIGINSPEMKATNLKLAEMRKELDRFKLENNNLYTRVADALEVNEYHQRLNGKLQVRIAELEDDNQRISKQIEDQLDRARKAGL